MNKLAPLVLAPNVFVGAPKPVVPKPVVAGFVPNKLVPAVVVCPKLKPVVGAVVPRLNVVAGLF